MAITSEAAGLRADDLRTKREIAQVYIGRGLDRSGRQLDERTMRTPIIINGPGMRKAKLPKRASIEDIGPTISSITGVSYETGVEGTALN